MRFLVDASLSPRLATILTEAGHDAVHLRERGLQSAEDPIVLTLAETEERVLLSADADFGTLLTLGTRRRPSVVLFRGHFQPSAHEQAQLLIGSLSQISGDLDKGALAVMTRTRIRIRTL